MSPFDDKQQRGQYIWQVGLIFNGMLWMPNWCFDDSSGAALHPG
jgi:hypothetical protein